MRSLGIRALWMGTTLLAAAAAAEGCGGSGSSGAGGGSSSSTTSSGTGGAASSSTTSSSTSSTSSTTSSTTTGSGGADGGAPTACLTTSVNELRGSAIALTSDDKTLVAVNRDAGTVSVVSVAYTGSPLEPVLTLVSELSVGGEPWQVVIDGCNTTAYVVLRKDQKVVEITGIGTATPAVGKSVAVGSEPTSLALTPNQTALYVSNWVDGTLSVLDPATLTLTRTIDLNAVLAGTGLLGTVAARPALAHPRAIAITNNGDASDADETVYVTEWSAVRTGPEVPGTPLTSDTNWKGLLYQVPVATGTPNPTPISLPPVLNTGFNDAKGNVTGCFPNQVASVTIDNEGTAAAPQLFAYVTSTCASPAGPTGVFQLGQCQVTGNCAAFGATSTCDLARGVCTGSCTSDAQCGVGSAAGACTLATGECAPLAANAKTTTHPAVTIVNLATGVGTTTTLDTAFTTAALTATGTASTRMPLLPTDLDFKPGFAYVAAEGADALFRLKVAGGVISQVGSQTGDFIDLHTATNQGIRLPIGVVTSKDQAFAFVNNDGDRDVTAIDLGTQSIAASATATVTAPSLATLTAAQTSALNGKRFFNTGLGRWSLNGAAWGSCGACHIDGLTDNVTWYFARGPRQTTSLDGTFNKADPTDQRILNWSAINDEIADFEANVRGISGGVGAIVATANKACTVATQATDCPNSLTCNATTLVCNVSNLDRINTLSEVPAQQALDGSSTDAATPGGASAHAHSVIGNWGNITAWIQTVRSPRAPTNLVTADVTAGQALFAGQGNCTGCHSGGKWTISSAKFYAPGDVSNDAFGALGVSSLSLETWSAAVKTAAFPAALFPTSTAAKQTYRSGAPQTFEQIQCALRPVGTIVAPAVAGGVPTGVSPAAVNVWEVRQDMATGAQGAGNANAAGNDFTAGYNVPSLLGMQVGAPYFHAGNARTLEEALSSTFAGHYQSPVAQVFSPTPAQVRELVAYLLSIDGSTTPVVIPALGASGGDYCASYVP